jgi:hypothetical protein
MAPNRIVALATPLAAPLAGAFAAWISQQIPGAEVQREALEETFLGVTGLMIALALQFNHNRFKWDLEGERKAAVAELPVTVDVPEPVDIDDDLPEDDDLLDDDEDLVEDDDLVADALLEDDELLDDDLVEEADEYAAATESRIR